MASCAIDSQMAGEKQPSSFTNHNLILIVLFGSRSPAVEVMQEANRVVDAVLVDADRHEVAVVPHIVHLLQREVVGLAIAIGLQEQPSFVAITITRMSGLNHALEVVIGTLEVRRKRYTLAASRRNSLCLCHFAVRSLPLPSPILSPPPFPSSGRYLRGDGVGAACTTTAWAREKKNSRILE
eukprot:scaffold5726_cov116-Isochrysis_galbana.AAC.1